MRTVELSSLDYFAAKDLVGFDEFGSGLGRALGDGHVFPVPKGYRLSASDVCGAIGLELESTRRRAACYEVVLSAPKMVSVKWGLTTPDLAKLIWLAHEQAVAATVKYIEQTESSFGLRRTWTPSAGVSAVSFEHVLSRNHDPHIHSHLLLVNSLMAQGGYQSDQTRALDGSRLRMNEAMFRVVYRHELFRLLERSGTAQGELNLIDDQVPKVAGSEEQIVKLFSSRRAQVERASDRFGQSFASRRIAALSSRPSKIPAELAVLRSRWAQSVIDNSGASALASFLEAPIDNYRSTRGQARGPLHCEVERILADNPSIEVSRALDSAVGVLGLVGEAELIRREYGGVLGRRADEIGTAELTRRIVARSGHQSGSILEVAVGSDTLLDNYRLADRIRAQGATTELAVLTQTERSSRVWCSVLSAKAVNDALLLKEGAGLVVAHPNRLSPTRLAETSVALGEDPLFLVSRGSPSTEWETVDRTRDGSLSLLLSDSASMILCTNNVSAVDRAKSRLVDSGIGGDLTVIVATPAEARAIAESALGPLKQSIERSGDRGVQVVVPPSFSFAEDTARIGTICHREGVLELHQGDTCTTLSEQQLKFFRDARVLCSDEARSVGVDNGTIVVQTRPDQPTMKFDAPPDGEVVVSLSALSLDLCERTMLRSLGLVDLVGGPDVVHSAFVRLCQDLTLKEDKFESLYQRSTAPVESPDPRQAELDHTRLQLSRIALLSAMSVSGVGESHYERNSHISERLLNSTSDRRGGVKRELRLQQSDSGVSSRGRSLMLATRGRSVAREAYFEF